MSDTPNSFPVEPHKQPEPIENFREAVEVRLLKAYQNGATDVVATYNRVTPNNKHYAPILSFMLDDILLAHRKAMVAELAALRNPADDVAIDQCWIAMRKHIGAAIAKYQERPTP